MSKEENMKGKAMEKKYKLETEVKEKTKDKRKDSAILLRYGVFWFFFISLKLGDDIGCSSSKRCKKNLQD